MTTGEFKRYRIKDKNGNTKDVVYDPSSGLSPQEFLTIEIARFNAEKEAAKKEESVNLDEKNQPVVQSGVVQPNVDREVQSQGHASSDNVKQSPEEEQIAKEESENINTQQNTSNVQQNENPEPQQSQQSAKTVQQNSVKKQQSLASIMASKSGVKLSNIAVKRNVDGPKIGKRPKDISIDSYVTADRLNTNKTE